MMRLDGRRLVRSLMLGVLVILLVGGATGVAFAHSDGAGRGLVVPTPGPGDRATYEGRAITLDSDAARPLDPRVTITVEWLPEVVGSDEDFVLRTLHPLAITYHWAGSGSALPESYARLAYYDSATGRPILHAINGTVYSDDGWHYGLVLDDTLGAPPERRDYLQEAYGLPVGECALRLPFLGFPYDGLAFALDAPCGWDADTPFTYAPRGWIGTGPERTFQFTAVQDGRFAIDVDVSSPFPARFHTALANFLPASYASGRHFEFVRVAQERSGATYGPPTQPQELGALAQAPLTPWLVDGGGAPHEFPISEAFAAVLAERDPSASNGLPGAPEKDTTTAAKFYAAHPGAYVAVAISQHVADRQGGLHPNWWFAFTDGHDVLAKRVERAPPAVDNLYLPREAGTQDTVRPWSPDEDIVPRFADGVFPTIDALPASLPRVADLMDRYTLLTGLAATTYGFDVRCLDVACATSQVHLAAGDARADIQTAINMLGGSVLESRTVFDHLWVAAEGQLVSRVAFHDQHTARLELVPSQVEDPGRNSPSVVPVAVGAWTLPPPGAVAGLSFLALVASALYYFWPALKGAASQVGLGLFSRIEDGKILEHPTRRRIHDAIASEPGIHFQALARKAGIGRGALEHHLRKLVAADVVTLRRAPGFTCYFLKGTIDRHLLDAAHAVRSDGSKAVLQAVASRPGASSRDLAQHLGLAPSTVSYHLKRLETAGLVAPGEKSGVRVTPLGSQAAA